MGESVAGLVARAEAALVGADARPRGGPRPDPIGALRLLDEAGTALEEGLEQARADQDRARKAAAALEQALLTARSAVAAAEDFITTRRGAIGAERPHPAGRGPAAPAAGAGGGDPVAALREAQQADALAQQALRLARSDVDRWQGSGGSGTGGGGSAWTWAASSSAASCPARSAASTGAAAVTAAATAAVAAASVAASAAGGFGGRSPGSFGGSSTRGRRGGGGRF